MKKTALPRKRDNAIDKRQMILETALKLFQTEGYRAVGIDRVIAESGVAKMTMYKHFASKNALIAAVLQARDERFRQGLTQFVARFSDPVDRLRALFLWHHHWFQSPSFHGCMFINALAEFSDPEHPARQAAACHKTWLKTFIDTLLTPLLEASDPASNAKTRQRLALQYALFLDGATVAAQLAHPSCTVQCGEGGGEHAAAFLVWQAAVGLLRQEGLKIEPGDVFGAASDAEQAG
ncbi:MAG: TetR/AcrR family transcriptional regulator [Zoogloeaceae bacterium]|nr:TetR/AcrR family transcriptional regulator [Zoogloeaceae bacterium]